MQIDPHEDPSSHTYLPFLSYFYIQNVTRLLSTCCRTLSNLTLNLETHVSVGRKKLFCLQKVRVMMNFPLINDIQLFIRMLPIKKQII